MKIALLCILLCSFSPVLAKECQKCVRTREHNKKNPGKYEYFEDYLKALKEGKETPKEEETNDEESEDKDS